MLESFNTNSKFDYQKLTPDEQAQRGILGRLVGVMADFKKPTRNGRLYTEDLWEQTFNNPIMKEKIENKCLFGELGHPLDRQEVDMEKIAICLAETPKKGNDGKLHGVFDILNTPNGKILKTLCDYGCNIGVSSRGSGDTYEDFEGQETVDSDTFECECWDAVILPAVKEARLRLVTESLESKKTLKQALQESLNNANDAEKKVMEETLNTLEIDYKDMSDEIETDNTEVIEPDVANNVGTTILEELQKTLKDNNELQEQVISLQEKLSVSYTKELRMKETILKLRNAVSTLTESVTRTDALTKQVENLKNQLEEEIQKSGKKNGLIESYKSKNENDATKINSLTENLKVKNDQISELTSKVKDLNESINNNKKQYEREVERLNEELVELKQDSQVKHSNYSKKLNQCNKLVEKYKNVAVDAFNRYIECKASHLGINATEIRNKLGESYTFDTIDEICENLRNYKVNLSKLPFNINGNNISKVMINESAQNKRFSNPDDDVDAKSLFDLFNID